MEGSVENLPLSSPTLAVVLFFQGESELLRAAVSQQGRFTALLPPGSYRMELLDLLGQEDLSDFTRILDVHLSRRNHSKFAKCHLILSNAKFTDRHTDCHAPELGTAADESVLPTSFGIWSSTRRVLSGHWGLYY